MAGILFGGEKDWTITYPKPFSPEGKNMRSLVVMFFFFVFIFGFGTILLSSENPEGFNTVKNNFALGQVSNHVQAADISTQVDRFDDPLVLTACTSAPNDCTLRSAISIANSDGKPTTISFAGNYLIRLTHPLPSLTEDKTVIKAGDTQEVHIDGQNFSSSVLRITGAHVHVEGLRIYGAGAGYPNIAIDEGAYDVKIAHNVVGDDDAPYGNCGTINNSSSGIFISGHDNIEHKTRAWIYGNVIECNRGDGIWVLSGKVIIGKDHQGVSDGFQRNVIRENSGYGINLGQTTGNTVCDNEIVANDGRSLYMTNFFDNNVMFNDIVVNNNGTSLG